jgi:hypothetical protein
MRPSASPAITHHFCCLHPILKWASAKVTRQTNAPKRLQVRDARTACGSLLSVLNGMYSWVEAVQVMSTFAQMTDLCKGMDRAKPLHIVAEARGPLLENFTDRLHGRKGTQTAHLLTSDILPTEEMGAGFIAQCAMQPKLSVIIKV